MSSLDGVIFPCFYLVGEFLPTPLSPGEGVSVGVIDRGNLLTQATAMKYDQFFAYFEELKKISYAAALVYFSW